MTRKTSLRMSAPVSPSKQSLWANAIIKHCVLPWSEGAERNKGLQDVSYYVLKHNELMLYAEVSGKTLSGLL